MDDPSAPLSLRDKKCESCGRPKRYDQYCGPCQRVVDGYIDEDALWEQAVSARAEQREAGQPDWAR